jgi:hypothetical protein
LRTSQAEACGYMTNTRKTESLAKEPEDQAEQDADENTGRERKVERQLVFFDKKISGGICRSTGSCLQR